MGFGIFNPAVNRFLGHFFGVKGEGGPHDSNTGYVAPYDTLDLRWNIVYSYKFAIVLGNLQTIRAFAYQNRDSL